MREGRGGGEGIILLNFCRNEYSLREDGLREFQDLRKDAESALDSAAETSLANEGDKGDGEKEEVMEEGEGEGKRHAHTPSSLKRREHGSGSLTGKKLTQ